MRQNYQIPQVYVRDFTNDMAVCINWFQQSLYHLRPCSIVEAEGYIAATRNGLIQQLEKAKGIEASTKVEEMYRTGLSSMKQYLMQKTFCISAEPFLEELREHLVSELFTKSKQLVASQKTH